MRKCDCLPRFAVSSLLSISSEQFSTFLKNKLLLLPQKEVKCLQQNTGNIMTQSPHIMLCITLNSHSRTLFVSFLFDMSKRGSQQQGLLNVYLASESLVLHYLFYNRDWKMLASRRLYRHIIINIVYTYSHTMTLDSNCNS